MKIFLYLVIVMQLMLVDYYASGTEVKEKIKQTATAYFLDEYNDLLKYFGKDTLSFSECENKTFFDKKIDTPFKNTQFYQFTFEGTEPTWKVIFYENDIGIFQLERGTYSDSSLISDRIINEINNFLGNEKTLNQKEIKEVIEFSLYIKYYKRDGLTILKQWQQIEMDASHKIPDNIKNIIKPIEVITHKKNICVKFYCWDRFSAYLYWVNVCYNVNNRKLDYSVKNLGQYGMPSLTL